MTDLPQAVGAIAGQPKTQVQDLPLAWPEILHQERERLLSLGVHSQGLALVIGHGLGQLEIAVIIEDGIERDRRPSGRLQMRQMLEAAAGARREFLGAREVFASMREPF